MKTHDFWYDLPEELIAQTPLQKRDTSRLLALDRVTGEISHKHFYNIIDHLGEGDLLVANDSRVLPARIYGVKDETGARVEFLLLRQISGNRWETLCKPGKKAREGASFTFGDGLLRAKVAEVRDDGNRVVDFDCDESFFATLDKIGQMPLPHYIHEELKNSDRYQTVYAKYEGSAAAPTAGLHFTPEMLEEIKASGINIGYVTLHVGLGTFRPVKVEDITEHKMHSEHYVISKETADIINQTKADGGRVKAFFEIRFVFFVLFGGLHLVQHKKIGAQCKIVGKLADLHLGTRRNL